MKANDLGISFVGRVYRVSIVKRVSVFWDVMRNRNILNGEATNPSNGKPSNILNNENKAPMNKHFTVLLFVFLCACSATVTRNDASISFSEEKHDFGTVSYKKEAIHSFEFTNPGKTMLIINDVKTSCGCTVPEWSKEPIRPGEKGTIKIKYDAAFPGVFHKTLEVFYNGTGSPAKLEIEGEVEYPEEKN